VVSPQSTPKCSVKLPFLKLGNRKSLDVAGLNLDMDVCSMTLGDEEDMDMSEQTPQVVFGPPNRVVVKVTPAPQPPPMDENGVAFPGHVQPVSTDEPSLTTPNWSTGVALNDPVFEQENAAALALPESPKASAEGRQSRQRTRAIHPPHATQQKRKHSAGQPHVSVTALPPCTRRVAWPEGAAKTRSPGIHYRDLDQDQPLAAQITSAEVLEYLDDNPSSCDYLGPLWPRAKGTWHKMLDKMHYTIPKDTGSVGPEEVKPGSYASIRFPYVTSTQSEVYCLLQSYVWCGGVCPIVGCTNTSMGKTFRAAEFLDHFYHVHRAIGSQLAYPCPIRGYRVVLSQARTIQRHLTHSKGHKAHTPLELKQLQSKVHLYPNQGEKLSVAYYAYRESVAQRYSSESRVIQAAIADSVEDSEIARRDQFCAENDMAAYPETPRDSPLRQAVAYSGPGTEPPRSQRRTAGPDEPSGSAQHKSAPSCSTAVVDTNQPKGAVELGARTTAAQVSETPLLNIRDATRKSEHRSGPLYEVQSGSSADEAPGSAGKSSGGKRGGKRVKHRDGALDPLVGIHTLKGGQVDVTPDKEGYLTVGTESTMTGPQKKKVVVGLQRHRALHQTSDPDTLERAGALGAQLDKALLQVSESSPASQHLTHAQRR
jgi:hypothetical protein